MSKFNQTSVEIDKTTNHEGLPAFKMGTKEKIVAQVLTTFFKEPKYYGDNTDDLIKDIREYMNVDAKFLANLAIYIRKEMHMRSISHALAAELANHINGKPFTRQVIKNIVERPDDMQEIIAYTIGHFGKPVPNSMKKGIADAFVNFDEFALQKYNRAKQIRLKDILCLVHPKPKTSGQSDMWNRLIEDRLETPVTWETELSAKGNTKEVWEKLIEDNRLGYMAMLRNLRNIIQSNVSNLDKVYKFLSDEDRVLKNKQLPFRYYSAYKVLKEEGLGTSKIFDTLEAAIKISTKNINKLPGKTLIATDVSGSMQNYLTNNSQISYAEIALLMLSIANYLCDEAITVTFTDKLDKCCLSTSNGIIANMNSIEFTASLTDITLPIKYLIDNKISVDRIIILTDNEINGAWDNENIIGWGRKSVPCQAVLDKYKREINPDVWVHAVDLAGYGTQQFKGKNVNIMAGWNEKIFDFIDCVEKGTDSLVNKIDQYYFK